MTPRIEQASLLCSACCYAFSPTTVFNQKQASGSLLNRLLVATWYAMLFADIRPAFGNAWKYFLRFEMAFRG
jgi:hypothetical protein